MNKLTDEVQYHDIDGNPTTLYRLIRNEPEWAASRIQAQADENEKLQARVQELEEALDMAVVVIKTGDHKKADIQFITKVQEAKSDE